MKIKKYKEKYSRKAIKKPVKNKKTADYSWIIIVTVLAFLISILFSSLSEAIIPNVSALIAIIIILLFISIGIIFDMVGIAITVADLSTFNSMSTKRVRGSNIAVKLIKNSEKASSFCNDVIGDICGIVSGSAGVSLASIIANKYSCGIFIPTLIITAIIAALTIGGKALGKQAAINKSTYILYKFSQVVSFFLLI